GKVEFDEVIEMVTRLCFMGAKEISLLDSTGMADPKQVKEILGELLGLNLSVDLAVHFHDTRGTGLVNCVAAYEAGVRIFDTAIGGLSGTPFGAPDLNMGFWNIPTEDLVHFLELLLESVKLAEDLAGRPLPGHILRAGPKSKLAKIPEPLKLK
ncbi:MAG: hydroxymethylglutaryl-CoA lyase, partial [Deltaproteobacteria bacterium]|nr:hydroxymethylglutaryl-CoA lyase [Deltaproteobacteria bacterium]